MTIRKKILIISDININSGFGKEHFVYSMAKELSDSLRVSVLQPISNVKKNNFNEELASLNVRVEFFHNFLGTLLPKDIKSLRLFIKGVKEANFIYLAEGDPVTDILLKIFVNSKKTKIYRGYHNPLRYDFFPNGKKISVYSLRRFYYRLILLLEKRLAGIHVENTDHLKELLKLGYKNVIILTPSIDTSALDANLKKFERFSVLFLGRLNYHKGSDLIPYILKNLSDKNLPIDIYIAGEGVLSNEIKTSCSKFENCHFLGFLSHLERNELLSRCHVLLAPTRVEAFMLTGIEAMAHGMPVISFKVPGPNDYIKNGQNGYLVDNADEMLDKLETIYGEFTKDDYEIYKAECLKTASSYSLENRSGSFKELIKQLSGSK